MADLGSVGLDWAAGSFQGRWEYGIGKISETAEQMAGSLRQTKQLYEQMDQSIAQLFPHPDATAADLGPPEPGEPSPISRALDRGTLR